MKDDEFCNFVAMAADAEQRATAMLIEMVAAAALMKLHPPARGDDVVTLEITQADMDAVVRDFAYHATYDAEQTMTITLKPSPEAGQA